MKKSAVYAALIVLGIGLYAAARSLDLAGLFKRLHGM